GLQPGDGRAPVEPPLTRVVPRIRAVERQRAVVGERPVPRPYAEREGERPASTIDCVNLPAGARPRIQIPRWIQPVGLPLPVLLGWVLGTRAGHVLVLFIIASLIALLLDPVVRGMGRLRLRRGFAVAIVYATFAAVVIVIFIAIGTLVVGQTKTAANRF